MICMQRITICLFSLLCILSLLILPPPAAAGEIIKVDALVVSAKDMAAAETKARHLALDRALTMMGNKKIPATAKKTAHNQADQLVTFRRVLNTKAKPDGSVQPVFFCDVDKLTLQNIINKKQQATIKTMDRPQINIGIVFRTLPQNLTGNRQAFLDRINNHLEEYFSKGGFRIAPPPPAMCKSIAAGRKAGEVFKSFVHNSSEVNYLLYGALDINPEDVRNLDNGRYFKTRVGLILRFYDILSHDVISFSRDVYGTGENEKASVINAMRNCAKVISEKVGINEVVAEWQRKLNEGFEFSLQFCGFHDRGWTRKLRRALKKQGHFTSKSRGQNLTKIYRFKADPGRFLHPSIDFEDFLDDFVADNPEFEMLEFGLMVQNDRLYYVFGDDEQCFDIGFTDAEDALK
ncbi:MAG: hypothetical protein DRH03_08015 [Deltaproteobacteria bacterium]|nr:MAG: hypothetical protein DRH03_08015 [Deltaproteobacteria bacterium]